jgi:hypothetical protein
LGKIVDMWRIFGVSVDKFYFSKGGQAPFSAAGYNLLAEIKRRCKNGKGFTGTEPE